MNRFSWRVLLLHELYMAPVVLGLFLALFSAGLIFSALAAGLLLGTVLFGLAIWLHHTRQTVKTLRLRLISLYLFLGCLYLNLAQFVTALGLVECDDHLLAIDRFLFGETPSAWFIVTPMLSEVMSFGYLSYQFYVHGSVLSCLFIPPQRAKRLFYSVFPAFAIGMVGYFLVPAMGPWKAYPELYTVPIDGYLITDLNSSIVVNGSPVYDVFPSLHTLITLIMLVHDRKYRPRLFRVMLPIAVVLILSTLYLRYHYAIDLLTALLVLAFLLVAETYLYPKVFKALDTTEKSDQVPNQV